MDDDKNGGPNNLQAWREFRRLTQVELAEAVGTTAGMISHLESGERGLSSKWLRRLAPALGTSPGFLLDHNPFDLDNDILEIWNRADQAQKKQIRAVAEALVPYAPPPPDGDPGAALDALTAQLAASKKRKPR